MYKKYYYNEEYFKKIDSKDKAYFLGLLYADGNVYHGTESNKKQRNRIQITLNNDDAYILQKFLNYLGSNSKLYSDKKRYTKLILDNKSLYNDIIRLGCIPNKSLILKFPTEEQVPSNLLHHFVRGYFDGDGGINTDRNYLNISFTSSEDFLKSLSELFKQKGIETGSYKKRYTHHTVSAGSIYIGKREIQKILYRYLYEECDDLFLHRKKNKFEILETYEGTRILVHPSTCSICDKDYHSKGFCKYHYQKNYYSKRKLL